MGCDVAVDVDVIEGVAVAGGPGEVEEGGRIEVLCLGEVVGGVLTTDVYLASSKLHPSSLPSPRELSSRRFSEEAEFAPS